VIVASVVVGVVGLSGSWALVSRRGPPPRPGATEWAFGLASLVPAWLVAFWGLLGPSTGWPQTGWVASSAAAVVGVILTDARARRLRESTGGSHRWTQWLLGVMALLPAWLIALIGLRLGRR
jgi:hypothetical protein